MQLFHFLKIILCFFPFFFLDLEKTKDISKENDGATEKMKKQLAIERTMKIQAVNKLAEIMNRKDLARDNSKKRKATSDDLRKKEKECRKLHQELGAVSTHSTRKVSVIKPRCTRGCLPKLQKNCEINLLFKTLLGLVEMMFGPVNVSFSLPEWQAVKMAFVSPWVFSWR